MAETEPVTQPDNPPAADPAPAPQPVQSAEQLASLQAELEQLKSTLSQTQEESKKAAELNQQYQLRLGELLQQQQKPQQTQTDDIDSQFDDTTKRYVHSVAERVAKQVADKTASNIMLRADTQQKLGDDKEVFDRASKEFQTLKQNPAYANLPDEIVESFATSNARAEIEANKRKKLESDLAAKAQDTVRQQDAAATSLPITTGGLRQPTEEDPDADLKHYMEQPESQQMFRKFFGGANPMGTQEVKYGAERIPANEAFKRVAVRAVRKGVGVSESLRGAFGGSQ